MHCCPAEPRDDVNLLTTDGTEPGHSTPQHQSKQQQKQQPDAGAAAAAAAGGAAAGAGRTTAGRKRPAAEGDAEAGGRSKGSQEVHAAAGTGDKQQHSQRKRARRQAAAAADSHTAPAQAGQLLSDLEEPHSGEKQQQQQHAGEGIQQQQGDKPNDAGPGPASGDHVWFPTLQDTNGGRQQLAPDAGISSRLCGPSRQVPSPAEWAAADHAVAPQVAMVILPGCPHLVPLQSLLAAGFLQQPASGTTGGNQQAAAASEFPAAAAAAGDEGRAAPGCAGPTATAATAAAGAAPTAPAAAPLLRKGPVSNADRKAAMAKGVSAAAAGAGAVASPTPKLAAAAADAAVAAATQAAVQAVHQLKGKGSRSKKKSDVTVAIASAAAAKAAAAAVAAVHSKGKVASALPALGDVGSAAKLWQYYTCGFNGSRPWQLLEKEGTDWRRGERQQWGKLNTVIKEIKYWARTWDVDCDTAAERLDTQRGTVTFPHWVKKQLPDIQKQRGEQSAGPQAAVAAATAAAAAAQAAAAAATKAAAAAAQAAPLGGSQ